MFVLAEEKQIWCAAGARKHFTLSSRKTDFWEKKEAERDGRSNGKQHTETARLYKACWVSPLLKNQQRNLMNPPEESGSKALRRAIRNHPRRNTQLNLIKHPDCSRKQIHMCYFPQSASVHLFQSFINMSAEPCGFAIKIWG